MPAGELNNVKKPVENRDDNINKILFQPNTNKTVIVPNNVYIIYSYKRYRCAIIYICNILSWHIAARIGHVYICIPFFNCRWIE